MGLERSRVLRLEDEGANPTIQFTRQQKVNDRGLDVLLLVLVGVKGVPQVVRYMICKNSYYLKFCIDSITHIYIVRMGHKVLPFFYLTNIRKKKIYIKN